MSYHGIVVRMPSQFRRTSMVAIAVGNLLLAVCWWGVVIAGDEIAGDGAESATVEVAPPPVEYPPGKLGEIIRLGEQVVMETSEHPLSKAFVGNSLNCSSCHLDGGRDPKAATFLGVASAYPAWAPREQRVITLEDRILNCFIRSQNGTRPPNGGELSVALAAYISWLSEGYKIRLNASKSLGPNQMQMLDVDQFTPSVERGAELYRDRCADCHADDGGGGDAPPVWGPQSFNDGAGMARIDKLASWLKVAMPPDETDLSGSEAIDLAAYINSKPRPKFSPPAAAER